MSAIPDAVAPVADTDSGADALDEDADTGVGSPLPLPLSNGSIIFLKYCIGFKPLNKDLYPDADPDFCAKYTFDAFFTFIWSFIFSSSFKNARPWRKLYIIQLEFIFGLFCLDYI